MNGYSGSGYQHQQINYYITVLLAWSGHRKSDIQHTLAKWNVWIGAFKEAAVFCDQYVAQPASIQCCVERLTIDLKLTREPIKSKYSICRQAFLVDGLEVHMHVAVSRCSSSRLACGNGCGLQPFPDSATSPISAVVQNRFSCSALHVLFQVSPYS